MKKITLLVSLLLLFATGSFAQTTPCSSVDQFSENFDSQTTLPSCWTRVGSLGTVNIGAKGLSQPNALFISATASTSRGLVALPPVTNANAGTNRLRFQIKAETANNLGGIIEVGYVTDLNNANTFTALQQVTASTYAYVPQIVDLGTFQVTGVAYLAFRNKGTNTFGVYIDNVYWEPDTTCSTPTNLTSSIVTATTATVSWTGLTTPPDNGYDYYYSTSNVEPTADTPKSGSVSFDKTSANLTGLTPNTVYYVWARSVCSSDKSPWYDVPVKFMTLCPPMALPWSESFEGLTAGATNLFPQCWNYSNINFSETYVSSWSIDSANSFYGSQSLSSNKLYSNNWAFTPQATLTAGTSYTFSYYVLSNPQENAGHNIEVKVGNGETVQDMTISLTSETTAIYKTWTKRFAVFTPTTTGNYSFGLHVFTNTPSNYALNLDDFHIGQTPTCAEPTNVSVAVADVTPTTAKVTWTEPSSIPANGYEYYVSSTKALPADTVTATGSVASGNFAVISNLVPGSNNYVWVRGVCSSTDKSGWAGYANFVTLCNAVSTFTDHFDTSNTLSVCYKNLSASQGATVTVTPDPVVSSPSSPNSLSIVQQLGNSVVLALPALNNISSGTNRLKLRARGVISNAQNLHIGYLTNSNDSSSFVELGVFNIPSMTAYSNYQITPQNVPANVTSLALQILPGVGSGSVYIDDLSWTPVPACLDPINLNTVAITSTSATVKWTNTATASTGLDYYYSTSSTAPVDSTPKTGSVAANVTTANLTGLASSTTYYVWVRNNCTASSTSPWSENTSFTTRCAPVTGFSENFDEASASLPACWSNVDVTSTGIAKKTTFNPYDGTYTLQLSNGNTGGSNIVAMVTIPPVSNSADFTHRIVFKAQANKNVGANVPVEFGYFTDPGDNTTFVALTSFSVAYQSYASYMFELTTANLKGAIPTPFLGFRDAAAASAASVVYIDDVVWEAIPTCPNPTNVGSANVGSSTATLFWTEPDAAPNNGYEYINTTSSVPPTATSTPDAALDFGTVSVDLSKLNYNTTYYFWVRSACSNTSKSPWTGYTYNTACPTLITPPYLQDFSKYIIGTNPSPICWKPSSGLALAQGPNNDGFVNKISQGNFLNVVNATSSCLRIRVNGAAVGGWMVAPTFDLSGGTYKVSFDYGMTTAGATTPSALGSDDLVGLYMLVNNALPWVPIKVFTAATPVTNTLQTFIGNIPSSATSVQLAFYIDSGSIDDQISSDFFVDNFKVDAVLGLETIEENSFTFYPNPVRDVLNLSHNVNITSVSVFNLLGQEVIAKSINSNQSQIDMSNLTTGTYLVRVTAGDQVRTIKVLKQ